MSASKKWGIRRLTVIGHYFHFRKPEAKKVGEADMDKNHESTLEANPRHEVKNREEDWKPKSAPLPSQVITEDHSRRRVVPRSPGTGPRRRRGSETDTIRRV